MYLLCLMLIIWSNITSLFFCTDLATGGSIDWVKGHLNVPLVYCYELRDDGRYGFLLPAEQIQPNSEEVMDSVIELIHQAERFGYMNSAPAFKATFLFIATLIAAYIF